MTPAGCRSPPLSPGELTDTGPSFDVFVRSSFSLAQKKHLLVISVFLKHTHTVSFLLKRSRHRALSFDFLYAERLILFYGVIHIS